MPMCGFNKKMREGLIALQEGLVEHGLHQRSIETGQTVEERLHEELSDMGRFSQEVQGINDPEYRDITIGLSLFAQAFYRLVEREGIDNYQEMARRVDRYFVEMDRAFYGDDSTEKLQGKPGDMRQLVSHLNTVGV